MPVASSLGEGWSIGLLGQRDRGILGLSQEGSFLVFEEIENVSKFDFIYNRLSPDEIREFIRDAGRRNIALDYSEKTIRHIYWLGEALEKEVVRSFTQKRDYTLELFDAPRFWGDEGEELEIYFLPVNYLFELKQGDETYRFYLHIYLVDTHHADIPEWYAEVFDRIEPHAMTEPYWNKQYNHFNIWYKDNLKDPVEVPFAQLSEARPKPE